jgi:hypothetical protein
MVFDGGPTHGKPRQLETERDSWGNNSPSQYGGRGKSFTDKNCKKFANISKC